MNRMRNRLLPYLVILIAAVAASTFIVTRSSLTNVSACVQAPGCVDREAQPLGTLTTRNYGFPTAYKQTLTFAPINNDPHLRNYVGYTSTSAVTKAFSWPYLVTNVVFWYALLLSLYALLRKLGISFPKSSSPSDVPEPKVEASA